ncbi:S41 family peptidase [Fusibacter tunisiensis]|uniref:Carboxyl-terminal processing protease n=1 Tax=Fusibacter tunisiensis TaxID=1008308 RepID=A0ABS2MRA2_9FIRM|nr:S41 family peptidase [Fusibacter tunisiensis]MBM7561939.1 carboxyl-terminal processing protease [Fusibacter tunisiensis]
MKKKTAILIGLLLVITTAATTFFVTTFIQIDLGDKVVISRKDLEDFRSFYGTYESVEDLKSYIEENYYLEVEESLLIDGMKQGLFDVLEDPYSLYMDSEEFQSYMESSTGEYAGIGLYLTPNDKDQIEVVSPIEDTPADSVGLLAKDVITGVNGVSYTAEQMDEAIKQIKGEPGTSITLTIYRPSQNKSFDVEIERAWIDIKVVKARMLDSEIGYLRLTTFDENSAREFDENAKDLISQGAKGIVLDLRQNPGGYLSQTVKIADAMLGKALIVYTEGRNGDNGTYESDARKYDVNWVVLIDQGSASASEILTGALKDHGQATIVGTTTFGKGVVQVVVPHEGDSGFKLTTSQYFTPSGAYIHGVGIEPDVFIELDEGYYEIEEPTDEDDNQLMKALEIIKEQLE